MTPSEALDALRVASVERLVRETGKSRTDVLAALRAEPGVVWIGPEIAALRAT